MGRHDLAFTHLEKYNYFNDSLRGIETLNRIADLEMKSVIEREKQKIKILEQETEITKKENSNKQITLYFILSGISLLLVIFVLVNRNLKVSLQRNKLNQKILDQEQRQLRTELSFKQSEIENFATYIQEKNKILEEVKLRLTEIRNKSNDSEVSKELLSTIGHNLYIDKDRKELELKINQVHQEFLSRLGNNFPNLTKTDLRLCSLLLLNLTSKDIAVILNIAPDSVKKSRNRLRKKLNLDINSDIVLFLKKI